MAGFDESGVYFSDNFNEQNDVSNANLRTKNRFKDFLRHYREGTFNYTYREQLKRQYNLGQFWIEINLEDLSAFDETLADKIVKSPNENITLLETAAKEVADEITKPRAEDGKVQDIQVLISSDSTSLSCRELLSDKVSKLVKISGIIVAASGIRSKAGQLAIQCRSCHNSIANIHIKPGLEGFTLPRRCQADQYGQTKCPLDPYFIISNSCICVDFQILKLQESPEELPQGEMPRHLQLYCDRYLCDKVVPGNRVTVLGIYSIKKTTKLKNNVSSLLNFKAKTFVKISCKDRSAVGTRAPYLRVLGLQISSEKIGCLAGLHITAQEEEQFQLLASNPQVYDILANSIAPSIYGSVDIKKAIACLLFGGSRKFLPDGLTRRGDINVLLLGDPGTAKSQLLKFVEQVSPIGVYTSGKGSSAAGLTASVIKDPQSGGAMVLADGGIVCIDEFDKMREDDRVAIHEAMEQQTISIAKAGITTTLNARCSVLAAANSVFGRWDEMKGDENIDFMPTILSRFDMIFIVKDEYNEQYDTTLARHVLSLHMNALQTSSEKSELSVQFLKKFIAYCRSKCGPRLSIQAGEKLQNRYVLMRSGTRQSEQEGGRRLRIPITVRQLEAIIRIAESLAKMQLLPFANELHIDEALRLFKVSTLESASSGSLAGIEGFTTAEEHEMLMRIEKQLKSRLSIGTQVSESVIVQDLMRQKYTEHAIRKVLYHMLRRGELQHRMQRRLIYRIR